MDEEKPLLADGSIVEDYKPLMVYWRKARSRDKKLAEKAILTNEDFNELSLLIRREGKLNVYELMNRLKERFRDRIDPEIAAESIREVYGIEMPYDMARDKIALILAGWLLEAGRKLKIIGYKSWRDKRNT